MWEAYGSYLCSCKDYEKAIDCFKNSGDYDKAIKTSITSRKWQKAIELLEADPHSLSANSFYKQIAEHFESMR